MNFNHFTILGSHNRKKVLLISKFFILVFSGVLLMNSFANANDLGHTSPADGSLRHILIASGHGNANQLILGIYYPKGQQNNYASLQLLGDALTNCSVGTVRGAPGGGIVNLDLHGVVNWQSINQSQLCTQQNHFKDKKYIFLLNGEDVAGTPYNMLVLKIYFNPAKSFSGADTKFNFQVVVRHVGPRNTHTDIPYDGVKIGNINSGSANNGIVPVTGGSHTISFPFGSACTPQNSEGTLVPVSLNDADNGRVYYIVQELTGGGWRTVPLSIRPGDRTVSLSDNNTVAHPQNPGGNPNLNSTVQFLMKPYVQYQLVAFNVDGADVNHADNRNYIYAGLPGDSIYGDTTVHCQVPKIDASDGVSVNGTSYTNDVEVWPGDDVQFTHNATNSGTATAHVDSCSYDRTGRLSSTRHLDEPRCNGGDNIEQGASKTYNGTSYTVTEDDVGKRYCEGITINYNSRQAKTGGICITVVNYIRPMVQFWGYDARAQGNATTLTMRYNKKTFGSWSEYGSQLNGENTNNLFASGAGYAKGASAGELGNINNLTFANTTSPTAGHWGGQISIADGSGLIPQLKAICPSTDTTQLNLTGEVTGTKVYCNLNGTIQITHNINYHDSSTNSRKLPQVIIIAKDILIDDNVTNVDAWLLALPGLSNDGGRINTCNEPATANFVSFDRISDTAWQSGKTCNKTLTINGPTIANRVYLNRTTNPDTDNSSSPGKPGEIFNLRADAFLWAFNGGNTSGNSVAQTESVKELPPRY